MPELPEVETCRLALESKVVNTTVTDAIVREHRFRHFIDKKFTQLITGAEISKVERRGKYLVFTTSNGYLIIHLGMSGTIRLIAPETAIKKHDHVDIVLSNNAVLRLNDPRRFGAVIWTSKPPEQHKLLRELGPEPLTDDFNADYLLLKARNRNRPIKLFIMDSKVVVGVGNIYANEALFKAKISPTRAANSISREKCKILVQEIKEVLAKAIENGGTTLRDFYNAEGKPGYFQQQLQVYGRGGKPCVTCDKPLQETRLGQRSTVFCHKCQD